MPYPAIVFWKKMPASRLLIPFFLGIAQQHYWPVPVSVLVGFALICAAVTGICGLSPIPFFLRYKSGFINGLSGFLLFAALGAISVWRQDVRNHTLWPGNIYKESDALIIKLREMPVEREKSYKSSADLVGIIRNRQKIRVDGRILVYFIRDSSHLQLSAGDELITTATLIPIPSGKSPGGFDFARYALFQGITHQLFVRNDFMITGNSLSFPDRLIHDLRKWVLRILEKAFPEARERGLAEALLIGYKNELEKGLVQSYTNTGVVHIIAISGLHLGLIYWLLVMALRPLSLSRKLKWLAPVFIITGLWLFALLAGAQPSVLRSAIMFTCIVVGNSLSRRPNIYNSLALSAFILLCYNPYWLWDAGFQLSYTAIIGIVVFMKPVYQLTHFRNRIVDMIWQMTAVTLSAQLLTLPVCIYHFHQFPNYFLLSNFIAVPLSSVILLLEILLCVVSFVPALMVMISKLCGLLIILMNDCIERIEKMPFAVWDKLQISFPQAMLLMLFILLFLSVLSERKITRLSVYGSLAALTMFMILRCISFIDAGLQRKIIVHQESADFVTGRNCVSTRVSGPNEELNASATRSFFRVKHRIETASDHSVELFSFHSKKVAVIGGRTGYFPTSEKPEIDLVILTQDPVTGPAELSQTMSIRQVVADAKVPPWKARKWQHYCDSLKIPFHDVRSKGAFVMNL